MERVMLLHVLSQTSDGSGVYCSPALRAVETAKIMAEPHKLDVKTIEGLTEAKLKAEFVGREGSAFS
jgi:broad specificity phosphatase PhoE